MMRVYAINGIARSGKDSFVNFVSEIAAEENARVASISTIDPIKQLYSSFFKWNGDKSPWHRKNLNTLKCMWIDTCNGPSRWTRERLLELKEEHTAAVFIMVREYNELMRILAISASVGAYAESIRLVREDIPIPPIEQEFIDSHPADYVYNWTINNDTTTDPTLPCLRAAAETFWKLTTGTYAYYHVRQRIWDCVLCRMQIVPRR